MTESSSTDLLRHFLAALAYRTQEAVREAPEGFASYRAGVNVRTPHELVWHMTGVIGYAVSLYRERKWQPAPRAPRVGWRPDRPPPAPGRPLT